MMWLLRVAAHQFVSLMSPQAMFSSSITEVPSRKLLIHPSVYLKIFTPPSSFVIFVQQFKRYYICIVFDFALKFHCIYCTIISVHFVWLHKFNRLSKIY